MNNRVNLILSILAGMIVVAGSTWILAFNFFNKQTKELEISQKLENRNSSNLAHQKNNLSQTRRSRPEISKNSLAGQRKSIQSETLTNALGSDQSAQFQVAIDIVASSGDFRPLGRFFDSLSQSDRFLFFDRIPSIYSKLGPKHDIAEKMAILEKINVSASDLETLRGRILQMEAKERYDEMKKSGVLNALTDKEFAAVCGRIATSRVGKGFAAVEDAGSETAMRVAAAAVARSAIAGGTMEASRAIGGLPAGLVRDEAVAELVLWLRQTNSGNEAAPWEALIVDEKAKARLTTALPAR